MKAALPWIVAGLSAASVAVAHAAPAGPGHYLDASGLRGSGECANFSEWYSLSTRPIAAGHTIANFHYEMRGDRKCGDWSSCEYTEDTATRKTMRFRMQGHSEYCGVVQSIGHPDNGTAPSELVFSYDVR